MWIGGASGVVNETLFVVEMCERDVLYVNEILEDILGPRGIDLPGKIRAAQNVAPGTVNPDPRSQTPRTKLLAILLPDDGSECGRPPGSACQP